MTLFLSVATILFVTFRLLYAFRRSPARGSGRLWITLSLLILVLGVVFYAKREYSKNKGPDDWGAILHEFQVVQGMYGNQGKVALSTADYTYTPDSGDALSGTYAFHFRCDAQKGSASCHYDGKSGKFGGDEVGLGK
jgi:hypothetical protein